MKFYLPIAFPMLMMVVGACLGQQAFVSPDADATPSAGVVSTTPIKTTVTSPVPSWQGNFERYVDLREMTFSTRYRSVFDSNGAHEFNQGQQRSVIDGKYKFDREGKYGVVFHASSGRYFTWSYADFMGGGNKQAIAMDLAKGNRLQQMILGGSLTENPSIVSGLYKSGGWSFYVRRLYLDIEPIRGVEAQYGSIDINRGAGSEITTYDYDGYITGERISIKRPENLFFDEASVTYGYLGDITTPNFFERGNRLAHSNYHQFLLRKKVAHRIDASLDYTWQDAANTMREAIEVKVPESRIVDAVRFETYQRLNSIYFRHSRAFLDGGKGYAITLDKRLDSRVELEAGVANIDTNSSVLAQFPVAGILGLALNGDQYGLGKRYFAHTVIKIAPNVELTGFYTHGFGTISDPVQIIWNKQAINAGLTYNIRKSIFKTNAAH